MLVWKDRLKLVDVDVAVNLLFAEGSLQDFEVVDRVDFRPRLHLHLAHRHGARVDAVDDLAVDDAIGQVLNLVEAGLKVGLDPGAQLLPAHKVALVHHPHGRHSGR